jgi:hypothetical protein
MASPDTCVFDLTIPRRPALDDVGGGAKTQVGNPDPARDLTANDVNQWAALLQRLSIPAALLRISVRFSGTTPAVYKMQSVAADNLQSSNITVTHNATGDVTLSWPAGKLPPSGAEPEGTINAAAGGTIGVVQPTATSVRVTTRTDAGTLADLAFTVSVS